MDDLKINASPTKAFFISMLVRDIPLIRAILDLIDNAVDGAKVSCGCDDLKGCQIDIKLNKDRFLITDNCGGIDPKIAKDYAFRFGRPDSAAVNPGSIGRFGVGMKRTLFKLGRYFSIQSTTRTSTFSIEQDVDDWLNKKEWEFEFSALETDQHFKEDQVSTSIEVTKLHESIAAEFDLETFRTALISEIETAYPISLNSGLIITLNNIPVNIKPLEILTSDKISPAYFEKDYVTPSGNTVNVVIYAGLADRSKSDSGWYVFCNGRMVLEHDQTHITGWGEGNGKIVSKFHTNFAYFRGFVFFSSDDAEALPWTTTKTGLDTDLPLYKAVRHEMIGVMKPILKFQSDLAKEKSEYEAGNRDDAPLNTELNKADATWFNDKTPVATFSAPAAIKVAAKPRLGRIQYNKKLEAIATVKKVLGVSTNKGIGEKTFDYFYENECE